MQIPIRVAVIGYGLAGSVFHAPLVEATPGLVLESIVTADTTRQAQARAAHPRARVLSRADEAWSTPRSHDLVVIATPTGSHVDLGMEALAAGLAVVIDKPLAVNAADARRLAGETDRRGGWLSVFHNRRWDGETLTAARLLAAGDLGVPLRLESRFERWRPAGNPAAWREQSPAESGGGLLLDLGSHLVDQATVLLGPVRSVYAELDTRRAGNAAEDDVFLALDHADGARSHLWTSAVAADLGPSLRLLGTEGAYVKRNLDLQEQRLRDGEVPGGDDWGCEPPSEWGRLVRGASSTAVETVPGDWPAFYRGVAHSLTRGTPPPVTAASALAVLEVLDAARESARRHQVVELAGG